MTLLIRRGPYTWLPSSVVACVDPAATTTAPLDVYLRKAAAAAVDGCCCVLTVAPSKNYF